jgi:hypothetical protein
MKEKPKDKIESIVDALFESDQMECTARYLTSGRRFAHLGTEEVKKRWTEAARVCPGVGRRRYRRRDLRPSGISREPE